MEIDLERLKKNMDRREQTRYKCIPKFSEVSWMENGKVVNTRGYLMDIGLGGANLMLEAAPPAGRLCKAKIHVGEIGGLEIGLVDAGCRAAKIDEDMPYWRVGMAFETLHPAMEGRVKRTVAYFKVRDDGKPRVKA